MFIQPEDNAGNLSYDQGHPVYEIYNPAAGQCLTAQNLLAGRPVTMGTGNRATTTGQIWWELHGVGCAAGSSGSASNGKAGALRDGGAGFAAR